MGLHVDIDAIYADNQKKVNAKRKQGFLVNDGDKLTKEQKLKLQEEMQKKYGLEEEYYEHVLQLPAKQECEIFDIKKIMNSRQKLSVVEKIDHLEKLKGHLMKRLRILRKYGELKIYNYERYSDYLKRKKRESH